MRSTLSALLLASLLAPAVAAQTCTDAPSCVFQKTLSPGAAPGDAFGRAVAADGASLVVGAPNADRVVVLARTAQTFALQDVLTAPGAGDVAFGRAVAVDGEWLLVGADEDSALGTAAGAAYVYRRSGGDWQPTQTLHFPGGDASDRFGASVAIAGSTAVVGAPGRASAVVYQRIGAVWSFAHVLAENAGEFGYAVAATTQQIAVGAWGDDSQGTNAGAVFVYDVAAGYPPAEKLTASDFGGLESNANDWFGAAVAMNPTDLVVGAYGRDAVGANSGAVYVYRRTLNQFPDPPSWEPHQRLTACDAAAGDNFGFAVAIDRAGLGRILVGAHNADGAQSSSGAAYVFRRGPTPGASFTAEDRLRACDADAGDRLGAAVAIVGHHAFVGADSDDAGGTNAGASYLFSLAGGQAGGCNCPCSVLASSTTYGVGKPGTAGVPLLASTAPPALGGTAGLRLTNAGGGTTALLLAGFAPASVPFDGGTLLVNPQLIVPAPTPIVGGSLELGFAVPANGAWCGATLHCQMMFEDPGAAGWYQTAQTNGVALTFGS